MKLEKEFNEIIKMPKEEQIKLLTNPDFLTLKDKCNYEFYDIFTYLIKNNQEEVEKIILSSLNLIKMFLEPEYYTYHGISFSYNFLVNLIKITYQNNIDQGKINMLAYNSLNEAEQEKILNENINRQMKVNLFKVLKRNVVEKYLNANYLKLTNREVWDLIMWGVNVPSTYYENEDFFIDNILSYSITKMNFNLNILANSIDITYLTNLKYNFFNNIILSYNNEYKIKDKSIESIFANHYKVSYESLDIDLKLVINLVIDNLFQDNLRNVCIDIEELLSANLKYNLIPESHINFYKKIQDIYSYSLIDVINLYKEYKKYDIISLLYDDIRLLKTRVYQDILNSLIKIEDINNLKNNKLSEINNTSIYEFTGEKFTLLVSCLIKEQEDITNYKRNCYSLISDKNMHVFMDNSLIFGYTNIDPNYIMHIYEQDAYSNDLVGGSDYVSRLRDKDYILSSNYTNEVQIINNYYDDTLYKRIKPSYIVCFDTIKDRTLQASKTMNLPIILIHKEKYKLDDSNKTYSNKELDNMYFTMTSENENIEEDSYKNKKL